MENTYANYLEINSKESYIIDKHKFEFGYYILPQKMCFSVLGNIQYSLKKLDQML